MSRTNYAYIALFILIVLAGAYLRLVHLGERPFHGDEANQAIRTGILLEDGAYEYDPNEHHGPTLYFLALVLLRLLGVDSIADATEAQLRLLPVLFGVLTIVILFPLRRFMGWPALSAAALLTAISPALTYYSRYFIQETLLLTFALAAIVCGWCYISRPGILWALLTGTMLGAMYATKETCVILFAAMGAAACFTWLLHWRATGARPALPKFRHALLCFAGALAVAILFYTSFFTHPRGFLDSFIAYTHYAGRAQGTGTAGLHDKPWYYYIALVSWTARSVGPRWSEGLIVVLALCGMAAVLLRRASSTSSTSFTHFLCFYAVILTGLFSIIPYKTPWNVLPLLHALILLAGVGFGALLSCTRARVWRAAVLLLFITGVVQLTWQNERANGAYAADVSNPYVYAHTSTNLVRLAERVDELAEHSPSQKALHINVLKPDGDYWPLPWYLREYTRVGYWTSLPPDADAPIIIAEPAVAREIFPTLKEKYTSSMYSLRPNVLLVVLVRQDLWDAFMVDRQ